MNLPDNMKQNLDATPWEMAMSEYTGKPPSFFRVPRDNPAVLTKEQQATMRDLVTKGSNAHKVFTNGAKDETTPRTKHVNFIDQKFIDEFNEGEKV